MLRRLEKILFMNLWNAKGADAIIMLLPAEIAQIAPIHKGYKIDRTSWDLQHNLCRLLLLFFYLTVYVQIHGPMWLSGLFILLILSSWFWWLEFLGLYKGLNIKYMRSIITKSQHCTASWRPCARLLSSFFWNISWLNSTILHLKDDLLKDSSICWTRVLHLGSIAALSHFNFLNRSFIIRHSEVSE